MLAISPGLLLQAVAMYIYSMPLEKFAIFATVIGLGFGLEFAMGRIRSRRSQREIDALDSLAGGR